MLTHPTLDQLRALKLDGMVQAFIELEAQEETRNLAHAEWLALLLDREAADRGTRRFQARLRAARLRHSQAAIEDVDYRTPRRLDKALFQQLATCRWIAEHRGLLVTGPCGIGKSWLSCALPQKACRDGYTVHYARVPRLFAELDLAHGDGRFARLFRMLVKVDLLVLDDWGPDRLSASQRRDLMEIVEDRHGRGSILITSQLPVATWHEVIGEPTLGDAILDRIDPTPTGSNSTARRCASSKPVRQPSRPRCPRRQPPSMASPPREQGNEPQTSPTDRPRGSTGTSRARRCVSRRGTPQRARVPPVDYGDGLRRA
jgi:DNA replication protein DnaC